MTEIAAACAASPDWLKLVWALCFGLAPWGAALLGFRMALDYRLARARAQCDAAAIAERVDRAIGEAYAARVGKLAEIRADRGA